MIDSGARISDDPSLKITLQSVPPAELHQAVLIPPLSPVNETSDTLVYLEIMWIDSERA